jgi:hypothetical protein
LRRMGMDESSAIESPMVARRISAAQRKFAQQAEQGTDARSAEAWLQTNGLG